MHKHAKHTIKKCIEANYIINLASLQIRLTPLGPELPCLATFLFSRLIRILLPKISRTSINCDCDEDIQSTFLMCQCKITKNNDMLKELSLTPVVSALAVQHEDSGYCIVMAHGNVRHNNRSSNSQLTKT